MLPARGNLPGPRSTGGSLSTGGRVGFLAFLALGAYMVWRAAQARGLWPPSTAEASRESIGHLGFTLVALLDAFVVISVLDLGAPASAAAAARAARSTTAPLPPRRRGDAATPSGLRSMDRRCPPKPWRAITAHT